MSASRRASVAFLLFPFPDNYHALIILFLMRHHFLRLTQHLSPSSLFLSLLVVCAPRENAESGRHGKVVSPVPRFPAGTLYGEKLSVRAFAPSRTDSAVPFA